jgi:AAHS family 4-hydroxybenzoate transporter-like MFS transporter
MLGGEASIIVLLAALGACTGGLQILLFAVGARLYEAPVRSTGIGSALALGRLGAIASSLVGAAVLQIDPSGKALFASVSVAMTVALVSVSQIRLVPTRAASEDACVQSDMTRETP